MTPERFAATVMEKVPGTRIVSWSLQVAQSEGRHKYTYSVDVVTRAGSRSYNFVTFEQGENVGSFTTAALKRFRGAVEDDAMDYQVKADDLHDLAHVIGEIIQEEEKRERDAQP